MEIGSIRSSDMVNPYHIGREAYASLMNRIGTPSMPRFERAVAEALDSYEKRYKPKVVVKVNWMKEGF